MPDDPKSVLTAEVGAVVRIRDRWYLATVNEPPTSPDIGFPLVTSGSVLRSGHWSSLGEALGITQEMVDDLRRWINREGPGVHMRAPGAVALADLIGHWLPPRGWHVEGVMEIVEEEASWPPEEP